MTSVVHAVAALLLLSMGPPPPEQPVAGHAGQTPASASTGISARNGQADGAETLESRIRDYWALRQQKNLLRMYPFYCAPYRSRVSETDFLQLSRLTRFPLLDIRLVKAAVSGDRAEVTLEIQSEAPEKGIPRFATETTEIWLREPDGRWCKEDEPLPLPSPP